jgi:hypothetical protein
MKEKLSVKRKKGARGGSLGILYQGGNFSEGEGKSHVSRLPALKRQRVLLGKCYHMRLNYKLSRALLVVHGTPERCKLEI